MVSALALANSPDLIRQAYGARTLQRANRAAMLDIELLQDDACFIPHATMATFFKEVEACVGDAYFGLELAQVQTAQTYGVWGDYVYQAGSLGEAINRAIHTIGYHSRGDQVSLAAGNGIARFSYLSAARHLDGYTTVAIGTAAIMQNLCRAFMPRGWRPVRIELDIPRPSRGARFEDAFQCPIVFDARAVSVVFETEPLLRASGRRAAPQTLTIDDLARARTLSASPRSLADDVAAHIRVQILAGTVSLDAAARAFETSTRSLQRGLNQDGTDFRSLVNATRVIRAKELLRGTTNSVTEISVQLGYSSAAHFARAFRRETGMSPQQYRFP